MNARFRETHEHVGTAGKQAGECSKGTRAPVGDQQIALSKVRPEVLEKKGFVVVMAARGEVDQSARDQAEHTDKVHRGKTAPGFLASSLRPALLVFGGIGHGNPGAIDQLDVAAMPVRRVRNVFLHALDQMGVDLIEDA